MKMSIGAKIRFLLLILGCCLIATSISLNIFNTPADILARESKSLEKKLNAKEQVVSALIHNKSLLQNAKKFHLNPKLSLNFLNAYRSYGINLLTYQNNNLKFWTTFKVGDINPKSIKEGSSVLFFSNGWYEVVKKTDQNFTFVFLIAIQSNYSVKENQFFKNDIDPLLSDSKTLTLANFTDKDSYEIKSIDNKFLFALKSKGDNLDRINSLPQVWLFVSGLLCILMFFNSLSSLIAKRGYPVLGTLLLFAVFSLSRITDLKYGWFNHRFNLALFDPKIYSQSTQMPSLGDFLLNVIFSTWLLLFVYNHIQKCQFIKIIKESKIAGLIIQTSFILLIGALAFFMDELFLGLILNSKINFDIINILKLGGTSWVSIVILCLIWFQIYLVAVITVSLSKQLNVTNRERLILFLTAFSGFFLYKLVTDFTAFFIVYALVVFLVGRILYVKQTRFSIGLVAVIFFCLAFNTSIKYIKYKDIKERNFRETLAQKVQSSDDPNAIVALGNLEKKILTDKFLINYFNNNVTGNYAVLKNHIKDLMDGYLSRYDYKIYDYNRFETAINDNGQPISKYKYLVESGAIKIDASNYFYKVNNTFGYQDYFGILPVLKEDNLMGTLIIEFRSKPYNFNNRLPDLLSDAKMVNDEEFKNYSIALYSYNKLLNQSGNYTFPLDGNIFKGKVEDFVFFNDSQQQGTVLKRYNHLIYKPKENKMVVITKEKIDYIERLAALSFFFLVFIIFSFLLYGLIWLIRNLDNEHVGWFSINRSLMINANKILYKTRIQVTIVLSVVATLLVVGWTTYFYMDREYRGQQDVLIKDKIRKVQQNFEKQVFSDGKIKTDDKATADFITFADINNADLNLYDTTGTLLMSTNPKLFSNKIISKKMGAMAYIYLDKMHRSEYINTEEKIGLLTYAAAYAPIRNAQNKTIAYISLPNYSNEAEYKDKIALFVSNLINIYALVFVGIGVLAVFLANQITSPLTFIQQSISKTKIGQRNEPIIWRRHDEIGLLIKEYNSMIAALEESALKLARSERESAWREMAKQVAHEIKNPLTPLKLGVQLLEKSWKENDPNFELKFNKFSKSFIEQIDSLSKIASEFSNFAKMPETNLEKLSIEPIIDQAREVFKSAENVEINIFNNLQVNAHIFGDRDQLLRTFNNLFKNAIEATEDERMCVINVILHNDFEHILIEVKDNGKGIPATFYDKIFVPNFTTKTSGTGLGLAFVKQAVENAGGKISFSSPDNRGTSFYIDFPIV
ncbi:HAMP domain-containing histidine kinase [Pedobacter changchengzhani]|uniref:histidine kinase n=1 Tax=Pedobacter changchengzhani TaxID=2529274 RepID=A0A4R5MNJ4_9SPHI|nr:HAMP domain-containing sensor histidine kinase [Pedobacter changchengzhani]TDG37357.1 HAMP domain-containing histidine kinase [Pedobacter changchengzhani]